jgi:twitching motility protein PilT
MSQNIDALLRETVAQNASDLHLKQGHPPILRVFGELKYMEAKPLTEKDLESYINTLTNEAQKRRFKDQSRVELSYSALDIARFRVNIFSQFQGLEITIRATPWKIPTVEELHLPPILKTLAKRPNGLVLISGPAGSGKSTTLAAMVDFINSSRKGHIITIEDPIEFVHSDKFCSVTQQEVGTHTPSFSTAIRNALRMDPDVIVVGEMRDLDTISNAVTAAETGHLVLGTVHTNDAVQAIDRLIDVFPSSMQRQIRTQLVAALQGVVYQVLLRRKDNTGRIPACEIMTANHAVRNLIKEAKSHQIYNVIRTGKEFGMKILDDSLKELYEQGIITARDALSRVRDLKSAEKTYAEAEKDEAASLI